MLQRVLVYIWLNLCIMRMIKSMLLFILIISQRIVNLFILFLVLIITIYYCIFSLFPLFVDTNWIDAFIILPLPMSNRILLIQSLTWKIFIIMEYISIFWFYSIGSSHGFGLSIQSVDSSFWTVGICSLSWFFGCNSHNQQRNLFYTGTRNNWTLCSR